MGYFLNDMKRMQKKATAAERRICAFILDDPQQLLHMSIAELAEKTETSYATVCRFCKAFGFDGFKSMKALLTKELSADQVYSERALHSEEERSFQAILQQLCGTYTRIISDCRASLREDAVGRAAELLLSARSIFFIGMGSSSVPAHHAYRRFLRFGIPCSCESDPVLFRVRSATLRKGDVVFAVSSSGRTRSVVAAADMAKQSGAAVISICDFSAAPLIDVTDVPLSITLRESRQYVDNDFPLILGQMLIIDLLHACCVARSGRGLSEVMEKAYEQAQLEKLDLHSLRRS